MTPEQAALVADGVDLAKQWTAQLVDAVPFWPLGLPDWDAPLVASGLRGVNESLVVVWWRGTEGTELELDLPAGAVDVAFGPPADGWHVVRDGVGPVRGPVRLQIPAGPQARVLRVRHTGLV
jgi:alpha-galactosidase